MQLQPYEKNAKEHPKAQIEAIAKSLARFGWQQPIKVGKGNIIIAGHGRYEAYEKYKDDLDIAPMWVIDEEGNTIHGGPETRRLTEAEEKSFRLADNKINAMSGNDKSLVIEELKDLELVEPELLDLTGYDRDLILDKDEEDDDVPEIAGGDPIAQVGDVYQLGNHRLMCGDSTDLDVMKELMGDARADMWLTDPPYNVDYTGKTKDALKIENDKKSDNEFRQFLVDSYTCADSAMKPGAVFYIWHADSEGYNFRGAAHDIGWQVRQCLIWHKNSMVMGRQDYHWKHEPCLYGWKDGDAHLWNADRTQTTILNFDRPTKSEDHPTMKPVDLLAYQITNNTKQEDVVLDSFLGSGSTLIACEKTGRICYGLELDPKYVDVIIKRWQEYTGKKAKKIT